jgi:UPF0755 protein
MKRTIALITIAAMCLLLGACSNKTKQVSAKTSSKATKAVSSETSSAAAAASSAVASSAAAAVSAAQTVTVMIPEGYCVTQIAKKLADAGVCSQSDFFTAVNTYPFTESSMSQIPYDSSKMCYRLEGYLFPNTYQFTVNMKAQDAIGKMLKSADNNIGSNYSYQTVIMASIIQKEAPDIANMKKISSVFHNRLNNPKQFSYLQSEATVYYMTKYGMPDDLVEKYKYYYNTQSRVKGLPAGPICNPGAEALVAAANPDNTNYLFYSSDSSGKYYYNQSYDQLQSNMKAGINPTP